MVFSSQKHTTQDLLYLVPLSLFFLLFKLGQGSLASWDEALYATVARGVAESGDWLTLRFNGQAWLEKPPLAIWATALIFKLFGVHEFSARFFSALCGVGCVLAAYWLGRQLFDRWTGFLGALVLLSSSDFIRMARSGTLDAPLTLLVTIALGLYWMGQEGRNRYLIFSGVALGLAVMTKGFAAFLVFPVVWLYALFSNRLDLLGRSSYWVGVMLAAAIALPWHLGQLLRHRASAEAGAFSWGFLSRPFQAFDAPGALWYSYVRVLVDNYHPWILVAIVTAPWFLFKAVRDRDEPSLFLSTWMFFIFGAITLLHAKHPSYLFPITPALSLTVAYALSRMFRERSVNFVRAAFLVVMALHVPYSHIFKQDHSRDVKGLAALVQKKIPADATLVLYNYPESPAVSFYLRRGSVPAETPQALAERLRSEASYVLARQTDAEALSKAGFLSKNKLVLAANYENVRLFAKRS